MESSAVENQGTMSSEPIHPYYPRDLRLPHYVPNEKSAAELVGVFFGVIGGFMVATWVLASSARTVKFSIPQRIILCWFVMSGIIHSVLEGYFGIYHQTLAGRMTFLGQVWKEYSKGDSRYLSSDTFVLCMERITAFVDGPLCIITVIAFFRNSPYRYVLQLIVSLCQLYGDTLYFMTEIHEDFTHGEMYHPQYFWVYFVFLNSLWIVIPFLLIIQASCKLAGCQSLKDNQVGLSSKKKKVK
ncbi:3-beta-hydroxysteroid-Delta(8),Delta(7)-isomerase-like isoform X2 [Gigantopelta aegis]|uniref:3-beta-hydroxysteroid-Delta(8), Delta(7)-isomerase-like isoform X2 n=1 Tax=Gigantopelta aegis TaxID=1735272 RepID=UPI001B88B6D5|nr:3-beta-hydroxysteroid-Delta(8),Delta(7)-isomerase-like isoform X2 [Gigantopelta aegis]